MIKVVPLGIEFSLSVDLPARDFQFPLSKDGVIDAGSDSVRPR